MLFLLSIVFSNSTQAQGSHPYAGSKTAFMHEDALSSDVFSGVAPQGKLSFKFETKQGAVPTILQGNDDLLQVICVRKDGGESETLSPYLLLLDPKSMETLTTLKLPSGTALNNIYGYLNEKDELMLANGRTIFRIVHFQKGDQWNIYPASSKATDEIGPLKNGMQRFDVLPNGAGAKSVWYNKKVRTTSVPKMGKDSKKVHFIHEDSRGKQFYAAVDFETGSW